MDFFYVRIWDCRVSATYNEIDCELLVFKKKFKNFAYFVLFYVALDTTLVSKCINGRFIFESYLKIQLVDYPFLTVKIPFKYK